MSKIEGEPSSSLIVWGPGNMIANTPQNAALLEQIMATRPLSSENLLKLAKFFSSYFTNERLAEHLTLYAAAQIINASNPQDDGSSIPSREHTSYPLHTSLTSNPRDDDGGFPGDFFGYYGDEPEDEPNPGFLPLLLSIKSVFMFGINFLVETRVGSAPNTLEHFVVNVSPDPNTLPEI